MKFMKLKLIQPVSLLMLTMILVSCTFEYKSNDHDNESRKAKKKYGKDVEITKQESQEKIDGQIMQISNKSIKKANAAFVDATIKVRHGKFYINDGAKNFVDAEFIYDKYELKPIMEYSENKDRGDLYIKLSSDKDGDINIDTDNDETKCLVELSNEVPMDLRIEFGAGYGKFNLNELQLEDLKLSLGAGEFDINLANSSVREIDIEVGVGSVELDLSGKRKSDLYAEILGGIGELDIKLPVNIGVKVEVIGILGDIDAHGFKKRNRIYTNEAYGNTDQTIEIEVKAGLGSVNLILVE